MALGAIVRYICSSDLNGILKEINSNNENIEPTAIYNINISDSIYFEVKEIRKKENLYNSHIYKFDSDTKELIHIY